jgi:glycosyltransferase involved in cell wall biosynthesis
MKIALYDPYLDALGGGEKYMMTMAEILSHDHDVSILWDKDEDIEKVEERFGLDLSHTTRVNNFFSASTSFYSRWKESGAYDVLIYLSDGSIPLVATKKLYIHFQFPIEWVNVTAKTKLKLRRVNKIITNSLFTKKYVDKKLGLESIVVYPPVSVQKTDVQKENIILHVGRFMKTGVEGNDYKKQYFMIDTFKELVDKGVENWKFVIAASVRMKDLADFQKMQATAAGYPISFVVNATNEDLWKYYNQAKIYWHASGYGEDLEKNPERAEHFGISTAEAMSAGSVPVVINAGGQKEIVTDGINGLMWSTRAEFISATKKVMDSPKLLDSLAKNAIETADQFTKQQFAEKIISIITK